MNETTSYSIGQNWLKTGTGSTTGTGTKTGGGTVWDSLFGNLGGILIGAGGLVTAFKSDPNEIARAQAQQPVYIPGIGQTNMSSGTIWLIVIVLVVVVVGMFLFLKGKK